MALVYSLVCYQPLCKVGGTSEALLYFYGTLSKQLQAASTRSSIRKSGNSLLSFLLFGTSSVLSNGFPPSPLLPFPPPPPFPLLTCPPSPLQSRL